MKEKIKNFIKRFSKEIFLALIIVVIASTGLYIIYKNKESHHNRDFLNDVVHSIIDINSNRDVNSFSENNTDKGQQMVASAYYGKDKMEKAIERMNRWDKDSNSTIKNTTKATISSLQSWKDAHESIINFNGDNQKLLAQFQAKIKVANEDALVIGIEATGGKNKRPLYLTNKDKQEVISYIKNTLGNAMKNEDKNNIIPELFSAGIIELSLEGKLPK